MTPIPKFTVKTQGDPAYRPMSPDGCMYCDQPNGSYHADDCVSLSWEVHVKAAITFRNKTATVRFIWPMARFIIDQGLEGCQKYLDDQITNNIEHYLDPDNDQDARDFLRLFHKFIKALDQEEPEYATIDLIALDIGRGPLQFYDYNMSRRYPDVWVSDEELT